jgi:uncharacterized protein (DUF1810 family)
VRVALIRHPAVSVAPGVCYGRTDLALNGAAVPELRRLAGALLRFPPGPLWCSPALRCRATASAVAGRRAVLTDSRLRELDFGAWEGQRWADIPRAALDRWAGALWAFAPPGGESAAALAVRVAAFHATLRARRQDCVVVAHGGPLKFLAPLLAGTPPDPGGAAPALGALQVIESVEARMDDPFDLQRFVAAQDPVFGQVLEELRAGRKRTHWMWFVFPQIAGLGHSAMAQRYAIASRAEAAAYLAHPVLGPRLRGCTAAMLALAGGSARSVLGSPDDAKLRSCLTLFAAVDPEETVFTAALEKYFAGAADPRTLAALG